MTTIYQLDSEDRRLLTIYSEIDTRSGKAFADAECTQLVDNWRWIVEAEIAGHARGELVECFSADGFSLHAPGSTDEEIASGDAPYLVSGPGRPTDADYAAAWLRLR